ncbi:replicative DNA helicase [Quadrisphaera sp. DSM 44207]|uniref:replicative DNA helicase n=1 Tax=Quadrisphaera sp. DSM 44207 TaxID=1881057 RepID=UPI00088CA73F|nr:replicative DNA helicase [Quadrisphaera sp. DSM 44207]SDQ23785.1 replicative DNA helicase [Quadrisphaera sp. DSM 44207]
MSLADLEPYEPQGPPSEDLGRTPPQDIAAEQSVLGGMMLSKDAIADVIEQLRGNDFYRPAHELIYEAILDLYGRGEPADAITVAATLTTRGELVRIGGAAYLHTLISSVPTAANAGYYARIVRERAVLRRLVEAGTRIVQLGYAPDGGDVDALVNTAQAEVYAVTERRATEDYVPLGSVIEATIDEIEASSHRGDGMIGVPTGFADLDQLTNGLHPGQMVVIAARPAIGKALALDTPLPTPTGWTTMSQVAVGEHVLAADGTPTRVVAATEVMQGRPCYEVAFDDGTTIVADAWHEWPVAAGGTRTTEQLARELGPDGALLVPSPAEVLPAVGEPRVARPPLEGRTVLAVPAPAPLVPGARQHRVVAVRPVASATVRCIQVEHPDHLYLAGRSMVPTHNSTIGLDIVRSASIRHGLTSVVFSLEMSKNEITMRLLSAEAKIPLQNMRKGTMREEDWTRLARTMGQVSEAPLFIDDSPNMTLMEIRAKCRRLKQRHDLRLVVIDYLQLMTSGKRVESRQQEVSEFSRALKLLAKELEVPVIAISQLNRGPEQRTDKRPAMSDLRESGCLTADTRVMRADTGAEVSLGELMATGATDVPVWALNERLQLVPRTLTHAFPSGTKEVYRLRLASGREVTATANHPFLTFDGWKPLGELSAGDRLGVVRHVPPPLEITAWHRDEVVLLAHLLGDGSFVRRQPIRYASTDEADLSEVADAARRRFGITAVRDEYAAARCTTLRLPAPYRLTPGRRNPIAEWLDGMGLFGLRSHEKFVPEGVFGLPKQQVALFLRHLWATGGCVHWHRDQQRGIVYYASTSRRMVDDVARLLLRFNIHSRVKTTRKGTYRDCYQLHITDADNQVRFLEEIGCHGARDVHVQDVLSRLSGRGRRAGRDTVPAEVWNRVRAVMEERGTTPEALATAMGRRSVTALRQDAPVSRQRLAEMAAVLDAAELDVLATNDVYWDEVVSINASGPREVYDATVVGLHNFVANGIAAHNSIEQDADMVILLHREDAYERESPRAGEADLIVAKHRNGPTDTIVVAFQGHYSRFVDMAAG